MHRFYSFWGVAPFALLLVQSECFTWNIANCRFWLPCFLCLLLLTKTHIGGFVYHACVVLRPIVSRETIRFCRNPAINLLFFAFFLQNKAFLCDFALKKSEVFFCFFSLPTAGSRARFNFRRARSMMYDHARNSMNAYTRDNMHSAPPYWPQL